MAQFRQPGKKRRFRMDKPINTCVWLLILFGSAMIASTVVGQTTSNATAVRNALIKQAVFIVIAYVIMRLTEQEWFQKLISRLFGLVYFIWVAAMCACFLFPAISGSHAWIQLFGFSLQPSEFGKPLMIIACADAVRQARNNRALRKRFTECFRWPCILMITDVVLLFLQKDYGTLVITMGIFCFCTLIPGWKELKKAHNRIVMLLGAAAVALVLTLSFSSVLTDVLSKIPATAHVAVRIENMMNPYTDVYGEGYQPANALYSIASSNILGKGYGNSARKYGYLTQADNDYILAVTIEELGIFGLAFLTVMYGVILYRLFSYAFKTRNLSYKVILVGTASYLFLHFALNVGGVSGLTPMTGIPLLFISSGGSSLMAVSAAIGTSQYAIDQIRTHELRERRAHERRVLRNV